MSATAETAIGRAELLRSAIGDWLSRPRILRTMLEGHKDEPSVLSEGGLKILQHNLPHMTEEALIAVAGALLRTSAVRLAVSLHMASKHDMRYEHARAGVEQIAAWAKGDQEGEEDAVLPEVEPVPPPDGMKVWKGDA